MAQRMIDLTLAVVASIGSFLLSWPYWRNFEYWAESHTFWQIYFITGFVLAVYVFYIFLSSLHTLFLHDAQGHIQPLNMEATDDAASDGQEVQP